MNDEGRMNAVVKIDPAPVSEGATLLAVISRAAADPQTDVEKMERLMAMYERMEAHTAAQEYADAMMTAQQGMPKVGKDRHNSQTNSDYATLDAINTAITPVYTRHGFSLSFDTEDSPLADHVRIVCHVLHRGGHGKEFRYDQPLDSAGIAGKVNKTPTHARGSSITYGRRYLTLMIFNLTTGFDDDGNSANASQPDHAENPEYADWRAAIEGCATKDELAEAWKSMPKDAQKALARVKDAQKLKVAA